MTYVFYILNSVVNAFTLGTFPVRPFLIVGYGLLLFALVFIAEKPYGKWLQLIRPRVQKIIRIAGIASLTLLFLLPVMAQGIIFHTYGIPETNLAIFFTGDEVTNTRVIHNHFGKTAISQLVTTIDPSAVESADTGSALLPYVPAWFPSLELIFLTLSVLASLYGGILFIRRGKSGRERALFLVLYTLVAFLVLEKSIDGGFLSDAAGVVFAAYIALNYVSVRLFPRVLAYAAMVYVLLLCSLYAGGFYWPLSYVLSTLVRVGMFVLAASALYYGVYGKSLYIKMLLVVLTILSIGVIAQQVGKANETYLSTTIQQGNSYLSVYGAEAASPLPLVGTIGDLKVYDASTLSGHTIGEEINAYHLSYWYHPFSYGNELCTAATALRQQKFFVLTKTQLTSITNNLVQAIFVPAGHAPNGWHRYQATLTYSSCIVRYPDMILGILHLSGTTQAIIYGLRVVAPSITPGGYVGSNGDIPEE